MRSSQWASTLLELEAALTRLIGAVDAYLVVNVSRIDDVFVQFHVSGDGTITAEASATRCCSATCNTWHLLPDAEIAALLSLGWSPPNLDPRELAEPGAGHPNFHRSTTTTHGWPPALLANLAVRTLCDVWHLAPDECTMRSGRLAAGRPPENI